MEIKDMQAFYAVVEEGNISHAAIRLDIAQPALSRQMKRLEASLGVKLFERGSRRIRLTEAGRLLYSRVEHILGMVDGTVREITEIGTGVAGSIRLGTIISSGAEFLPNLLAAFNAKYPQVTFQIWEGEGTRVFELLDSRAIEIGLTRTLPDANLYHSVVLSNEPLMMVMNRENHICGKKDDVIRVKELKEQPIILPFRWKGTFIAQCKKAGFEPKLVCESDSIVQDILNVRTGLGMALVPRSALSLMTDDGQLVCKKIVDPDMMTHTVVSWLKARTLSAAARHFLQMFREMYMTGEEKYRKKASTNI